MEVIQTAIPDVRILIPARLGDHRGFFSETYSKKLFTEVGIPPEFVQDNHSLSTSRGVLRGLHYQIPPLAQDKLVRVARGAIRDVAVDIRRGSPTFGCHVSVVLSAENWRQVFIPAGFAHGFLTLEPDSEVIYKVSAYYSPPHERGVLWNDPALGIDWGVDKAQVVLSEPDKKHPRLAEVIDLF